MSQSSNSIHNQQANAPLAGSVGNQAGVIQTGATGNTNTSDNIDLKEKSVIGGHSSAEIRLVRATTKCIQSPGFISASAVAAGARSNMRMMPEISDEELLEMAIKFEKNHPQ